MSTEEDFIGPAQYLAADRVRVSAYYDEAGRMTNVDLILNDEDVTPEEIGQLIRMLARKGVPPMNVAYTPS